jgi:hypothetical protein
MGGVFPSVCLMCFFNLFLEFNLRFFCKVFLGFKKMFHGFFVGVIMIVLYEVVMNKCIKICTSNIKLLCTVVGINTLELFNANELEPNAK